MARRLNPGVKRLNPLRMRVLLRAAYDLIKRSEEGPYVQSPTEICTHYDGADCDGFCLKEDIRIELGLDDDTEPIPLKEKR